MDTVSKSQRSINMSHIKGKDTSIELKVRKYLFKLGYRYRLHDRNLSGRPDIVLRKYKTVIFINGCFWHRHQNCKYATMPKSNIEYWQHKFERNVKNDKRNQKTLLEDGWNVIVLWECELKKDLRV